jgi:hypothetical protein
MRRQRTPEEEDRAMIGRFGDPVIHLPSGTRGKVVMDPSGSIGILSTAVELENGQITEFPDSQLRVSQEDTFVIHGIRFASNRPTPGNMELLIHNNGDGTVTITGQVPGGARITLHNLPIQDGEIVLPDEAFFPIHR